MHIPIPAIIPKETFEQVQKRFEKNRALALRNTKREYLLSGLSVCGKCGQRYTGWTSRGKSHYRCCSKRGDILPEPCPSSIIRGEKIEPLVWDTVSRLLAEPQLIIDQVKNIGRHKPSAHLEASLDRVCHALDRKKAEADRMLDAYKIGAIDLQTLKREMDEMKEEQVKLEGEKMGLEKELRKAEALELNEEKLYQFCQSLPTTLANLNFEDKKQILRDVVDRILIDGEEVTIYGIIPMPEQKAEDVSIELQSPSQLRHNRHNIVARWVAEASLPIR